MRKEEEEINKNILLTQSLSCRKRGRPRLHRRDKVDEDARMFAIKNGG